MLQKEMRKKLTNQNWEYVAKHDANPSQTFHRIRTKVNRAFYDFELLMGAKFPEGKEEILFSADKISRLAEALLRGSDGNGLQSPTLQRRRSQLALIFAEVGLKFLITQYSLLSKRTPFLGQTAINELERTIQICRDISDEIQSRSIESKTQREKAIHIFDWDNVPGRHEHRLQAFLIEQIRIKQNEDIGISIEPFKAKKDENNTKLEYGIHVEESSKDPYSDYFEKYSFEAIIKIESENRALLRILNSDDREIHRQELVVQKEKNNLHILIKE